MRRGFGLAFVLVVVAVVTTLVAAAATRFFMTTRTLRIGPHQSVARMMADSGLDLAIVLMRDQAHDWYSSYTQPVTNGDLGMTDLGGDFELSFHSLPSLSSGAGTFITIRCRGRAAGKEAISLATVKVTSLISNYLFFSNGDFRLMGNGTPANSGPILVNGNGDEGNFRIWHDRLNVTELTNRNRHDFGEVTLSGSVRANGRVFLRNRVVVGAPTLDSLQFNGNVPPGRIVHEDLPGTTARGSLVLPREVEVEADSPLRAAVPRIDSVMRTAASQSGVTQINVGGFRDGVLAEFVDGKLILSEARRVTVGRVYDKDVYLGETSTLISATSDHYGNPDRNAMHELLKREVVWDDPDFPDAPYPPDLVDDLNSDGLNETSGDYFELQEIVRGPAIPRGNITLDPSRYSFVQLVTDRTNYPGEFGPQAPPVYVRGIVDGRINLSYTVSDPSLDPTYDRLNVMILSQHEDPDVAADRRITTGTAPGVPGGLRFADPTQRPDPSSSVAGSEDMLILSSRGSLTASGPTGFFKTRVRATADTPGSVPRSPTGVFDQSRRLVDLDNLYSSSFGSGPWAADEFRTQDTGQNRPSAHLQGMFVAARVDFPDGRLTSDGGISGPALGNRRNPRYDVFSNWTDYPSPWPTGVTASDAPVFGTRFRNTRTANTANDFLKGTYASLAEPLGAWKGERYYDYSWQDMTASDLTAAGVPLTVVLCTYQRQ